MSKFGSILVIAALAICKAGNGDAADVVTWGAATNISGDSDVITEGGLVYAYNLGANGVATTTVNGVTFTAAAVPVYDDHKQSVTFGSVVFSEDQGDLLSYNTLGTATGAFSSLSSNYQSLLSSGGGSIMVGTVSTTLNGLTAGHSYKFQWWLNNSSKQAFLNVVPFLSTSATATNSVTLNGNVGDSTGNLGQFVIGSFVASSSSALIQFNGQNGSSPMINAFQLRDVTPVPEPATYTMATLAAMILLGWKHARKSNCV